MGKASFWNDVRVIQTSIRGPDTSLRHLGGEKGMSTVLLDGGVQSGGFTSEAGGSQSLEWCAGVSVSYTSPQPLSGMLVLVMLVMRML